jgi:hypothetical protein
MAAAQALVGEFSEDGLAAMAGEDNLQMALARNLTGRIDDADVRRSWGEVKGGPKKVRRPTAAVAGLTPDPKPGPLDALPIELQMVAETMIEGPGKPVPPEALAGFPDLHATLAALAAGFDALETNQEFADHDADTGEEADEEEGVAEDAPVPPAEEFDDDFDEPYQPEPVAENYALVMTPEILTKMFANLMAHGLELG